MHLFYILCLSHPILSLHIALITSSLFFPLTVPGREGRGGGGVAPECKTGIQLPNKYNNNILLFE